MKRISLLTLQLNDFQGGTFCLSLEGADCNVFGDNSSGKTRLASAFSWLLFGKDSLGRTDFSIKNLNADGEAEHGLSHTVEGTLLVDGEEITLKKVFSEKWVKPRGRAKEEFSGHQTQHFINGIPKSEKEYRAFIEELAGAEETFRLVTSPTAFPSLPWQRQRAILLEVCGDLSTEDVITLNPKLAPLTKLLKKFRTSKTPFEDLRAVTIQSRAQINKELPQIAVRIDEVHRGLPDIAGLDRQDITAKAESLEISLNASKLNLQGLDTGGYLADLTKRLSVVNADLQKVEGDHYSATMRRVHELNAQLAEVETKIMASKWRAESIASELRSKGKQVEESEKTLADLREKWKEVDAKAFKNTTEDACPTCGQMLPTERVQEARESAIAAFNRDKSERLAAIDQMGKSIAEERSQLQADIMALEKEAESLPSYKGEVEHLTTKIRYTREDVDDFHNIPGHSDLIMKRADMEDAIKAEKEGRTQDLEGIRKEIDNYEQALKDAKGLLDRFTRREAGEKRIEELKVEEKKLSAEFEELEQQLFLCDEFVRAKVSMLTERINSKFETVRFKLFSSLINGGLEECCVSTVLGVPYDAGLNTAARMQAGCEIVAVLQKHYGISVPIWLDNRESVTEIPSMPCQIISLYVSLGDKTLRVEKAKERNLATA